MIKSKLVGLGALVTLVSTVALSSVAAAAGTDYTALTSDVSTEIAAAVPIALAAVGTFVGIVMAYKLVRKLLRA